MADSATNTAPAKIPLGFRIIGAFKMIVALLLVAAAFGMFRLMDKDIGAVVEHAVLKLHLDPENRLVSTVSFYLLGIDHRHVEALGIGTLFYALLYGIEGLGIFLGAHWAEYLIVCTTAALIPLEIYELLHKTNGIKMAVFVANIAILVYFVRQLLRERWRRKERHPAT